jgi:hypothetical protein
MGEAFQNSSRESVRGFWCDGVLLPAPEADYSRKSVQWSNSHSSTISGCEFACSP